MGPPHMGRSSGFLNETSTSVGNEGPVKAVWTALWRLSGKLGGLRIIVSNCRGILLLDVYKLTNKSSKTTKTERIMMIVRIILIVVMSIVRTTHICIY